MAHDGCHLSSSPSPTNLPQRRKTYPSISQSGAEERALHMHAVHERHCLNPVPALPSILFRLWLLSRYLGSVCTKTAQHRPGPWAPCTLSRNSAPRRGARYGIHGCGEFRVTALSYLQSSSQRRQRCFPPPRHCYGEHPARQKNSLDLLRTADAHSPRRDLCRQRTLSWHTASIA